LVAHHAHRHPTTWWSDYVAKLRAPYARTTRASGFSPHVIRHFDRYASAPGGVDINTIEGLARPRVADTTNIYAETDLRPRSGHWRRWIADANAEVSGGCPEAGRDGVPAIAVAFADYVA